MKKIKLAAKDDMLRIDTRHWCKAYFQIHSKCDIVDNNMCEAFNGILVSSRHKAILGMLEEIRRTVMKRTIRMQKLAEKFKGEFGSKIWEKIEANKAASSNCHIRAQGALQYEFEERKDNFVVDVSRHTCTCRVWDLTGIPCKHAIPVISHRRESIENYVHPCYKKETYIKIYDHCILPLDGIDRWEETNMPPMDPPALRKKRGRPAKKRRLEEWEAGVGTNITRKGRIMTCQICFQRGHIGRSCPTKKKQTAEETSTQTNYATEVYTPTFIPELNSSGNDNEADIEDNVSNQPGMRRQMQLQVQLNTIEVPTTTSSEQAQRSRDISSQSSQLQESMRNAPADSRHKSTTVSSNSQSRPHNVLTYKQLDAQRCERKRKMQQNKLRNNDVE